MVLRPVAYEVPMDEVMERLAGRVEALHVKLDAVAVALHAVLELLSDGEAPPEGRTLDGDLFSTVERDQTQPL